tara:strand:- start:7933 stop:8403 length:471 start_codon:yes stop_codon:yes gene_type:complete
MNKRKEKILLSGITSIPTDIDKMPNSQEKTHYIELEIELRKSFPKPTDSYMKNGMRFSNEIINQVGGNVVFLPIEWMSDFIHEEDKIKFESGDKEVLQTFEVMLNMKELSLFYLLQQSKPRLYGLAAYTILNTRNETLFNSALLFLCIAKKNNELA